MNKVKLFKHYDIEFQEREMNKWFEDNPSIKVVKTNQSSVFNTGTMYTIISVFYKPIYRKPDTGPR